MDKIGEAYKEVLPETIPFLSELLEGMFVLNYFLFARIICSGNVISEIWSAELHRFPENIIVFQGVCVNDGLKLPNISYSAKSFTNLTIGNLLLLIDIWIKEGWINGFLNNRIVSKIP